VDVDDAINQLKLQKPPIKAVVTVATYRAVAKFIEKTHDLFPGMIYTNVSFAFSFRSVLLRILRQLLLVALVESMTPTRNQLSLFPHPITPSLGYY
jgi:hypothetical protein